MSAFVCLSEHMHPYECGGSCLHCRRLQRTSLMTGEVLHDPATCELCDPEYDGQTNPYREASA